MKRSFSRYIMVSVLMLAMLGALVYQLGILTLVQGQAWAEEASGTAVRTITTKGKRGSIVDRNGVVLAYDQTCYDVEFLRNADNRTSYDSAVYTDVLMQAIEIIEATGGKTINTSYLAMDESNNIVYDWGVTSYSAVAARYRNYLEAVGINIARRDEGYENNPKDSSKWDLAKWPTAEFMYNYLRALWFIPEEYSFEQANKVISIRQEVCLNNYRAYRPITIAHDVSFEVVAEIKLHSDRLIGLQVAESTTRVYPKGANAAHILGYMSKTAGEVTANSLLNKGYTPAELVPLYEYVYEEDENGNTVYDTNGRPAPKRDENGNIVYVYDENGNHIIDMTSSSGLNYSYDDSIGVYGIESTMEAYLTGATKEHQGERNVEVNKNYSIIRELSTTLPTDGNTVMLTIDYEFQAVCERALENLIKNIEKKELETIEADIQKAMANGKVSKYADKEIDTAKTGAIVAMNPKTGEIMALASYPSFDPNWFVNGLSVEQAEYIADEATTPMRNKAISAKLAPGSIFKMVTGVAGVAEGAVGVDEVVNDKGDGGVYYIYEYDEEGQVENVIKTNAPSCWKTNHEDHANLNLTQALAQSCNFYFCELAYRLGIDKLNDWAGRFGLTTSTNIELTGESVGILGGQKTLFDNTLLTEKNELDISGQKTSLPSLVYRHLCTLLRNCMAERMMEVNDEAVRICALKLMQIQDGGGLDGKGPDIRKIISDELGIPEGYTQTKTWVADIINLLNEIQWKSTLTIRAGFGQGTSLITPVAVARYISTIANEGTVYSANIVDKVLDERGNVVEDFSAEVISKIGDDSPEWKNLWAAIKEGMKGVVSLEDQGTAAGKFTEEFTEMGYDQRLTGKTGSAQIGLASIDVENTSWFVTYTPREEPDLVLVICIPNGYAGAWSIPAAEEIYTYYFNKTDSAAPETLVEIDGAVP